MNILKIAAVSIVSAALLVLGAVFMAGIVRAEPHPACKALPEGECTAKQIEGVNICAWVKPRETVTKTIAGYCRVSNKTVTPDQATKIRAALGITAQAKN